MDALWYIPWKVIFPKDSRRRVKSARPPDWFRRPSMGYDLLFFDAQRTSKQKKRHSQHHTDSSSKLPIWTSPRCKGHPWPCHRFSRIPALKWRIGNLLSGVMREIQGADKFLWCLQTTMFLMALWTANRQLIPPPSHPKGISRYAMCRQNVGQVLSGIMDVPYETVALCRLRIWGLSVMLGRRFLGSFFFVVSKEWTRSAWMRFDICQGGQADTVLFGLRFKNPPLCQKISIRMLNKKMS